MLDSQPWGDILAKGSGRSCPRKLDTPSSHSQRRNHLWADEPIGAVSAIPIVVDLDVLEDVLAHLRARRDSLAVVRLNLQRMEAILRTRVVEAMLCARPRSPYVLLRIQILLEPGKRVTYLLRRP